MGETATPAQRWRAAVASVPLEAPRAFPTTLRPLVARLAGSAERAAYTTGPATRRALTAAGALGATTGSVVHLAAPPSADPASMGVLAHELSHARNPVSRPRFLLRDPGGAMDADERSARSVGEQVQATVQRAAGTPGLAVQRLLGQGSSALGGLRDRATSAVGGAGAAVNDAREHAGAFSAGIVDNLRVGGGSAAAGVMDAARSAGAGVADTVSDVGQDVSDTGDEVSARAREMLAQLDSLAGNAGGQAGRFADQAMSTVDDGGQAVEGAAAQGQGLIGQARGAAAGLASAAGGLAAGDLDKIVEALEERLLRELERRGGRYAGVF